MLYFFRALYRVHGSLTMKRATQYPFRALEKLKVNQRSVAKMSGDHYLLPLVSAIALFSSSSLGRRMLGISGTVGFC